MNKFRLSFLLMLVVTLVGDLSSPLLAESAAQKPLWKAGQYYGGYPSNDKFLTQGITFKIAPDKITMKDINLSFPADFIDETGTVSPRYIRFSESGIEPLTLRRTSQLQRLYFAYLDAFNNNWNTELLVQWNRAKQSFRITINTQSDPIENTFYKASATLTLGAIRKKNAS